MSITINSILREIQEHFIEPVDDGASWASGFWTPIEVIRYLDNRQRQFLKETGILLKRGVITTTLNISSQPYPSDWICTQRVTWRTSGNVFTEVAKGDGWEADHGVPTWPTTGAAIPKLWFDAETPTLNFYVAPPPTVAGGLQILYVYSPSTSTGVLGGRFNISEFRPAPHGIINAADRTRMTSMGFTIVGVVFEVPDEFVPVIKWGTMADMLNKVGRAQDTSRGAFCESRYQQGVEAAKLILQGWANV